MLNKWKLLTAMQALSIYIIIRLDEGEKELNHLDALLLAAVTVRGGPQLQLFHIISNDAYRL